MNASLPQTPYDLYRWKSPHGNVGDDLNVWLWPRLFGSIFQDNATTRFIGIGSVLDSRHSAYPHKIVFGAGARSDDTAPNVNSSDWDVRFVRGPMTARALGISEEYAISDPAILAPLFYPTWSYKPIKSEIGFIPYFQTPSAYTELIAERCNLRLIPPTLAPQPFMDELAKCEKILSEAMHGAILADAFGIPWAPITAYNIRAEGITSSFKWSDWLRSVNLDVNFITLPIHTAAKVPSQTIRTLVLQGYARAAARRIKHHISSGNWYVSKRKVTEERQLQILTQVENLCLDASIIPTCQLRDHF